MATLLRGARKGQTVRLHQWANDWFSVDYPDGSPGILTPLAVHLDTDEIAAWRANPSGMDRGYALGDDGRFRRLPARARGGRRRRRRTRPGRCR